MTNRDPDLDRAIDLARSLERPMPTASRVEEARTALLAAASLSEPRRSPRLGHVRLWLGGAALAAAAAAIALVVWSRSAVDTGHRHGTVTARGDSAFVRLTSMPDEIVMLYDGTIDVDVDPLHPRERFRVVIGADEVEVHGTSFAVTAGGGRLLDVAVRHGVVEVRAGTDRQMLTAGTSWRARTAVVASADVAIASPDPDRSPGTPVSPADAQPRVKERATPTVAKATTEHATTAKRTDPKPDNVATTVKDAPATGHASTRVPEEIAYDDAWTAMRANRFREAASAFARVQLLAPTGPLAEDAGYWYAVALARSGQPALATTAFRDFLDAFPAARRAGEASAMLGWILLEAGATSEAESRFRAASADLDPNVRASAKSGLDAVAKLRAK